MRKIIVIILAVALVVTMLLPLVSMLFVQAEAVTQTDLKNQISGLKGSASELKAEKSDLQAQLKEIQNDKSKALEQKSLLEEQMQVIQRQIENLTSQIAEYDALIQIKGEEITEIQAREAQQYALFCERVRAMEKTGTPSYWAAIFNATDFSDLLDRVIIVDEIMDYDNAVMEALSATRQELATAKEDLELERAEQESAKAEQVEQKAELKEREEEVDALVAEIKNDEATAQAALDAIEAEAAKLDKEIAAKQKELEALIAAGSVKFVGGNGYIWPLSSGHLRISSRFGWRKHPISGKNNFHSGIDLPAPQNTKIYAARGGVVSISTYNRSYGNYVVLLHDNGISTLYAHMNSRAVKVGDVVTQGQVIGYVGTTGSSTGNHLHFEIRENGTRVNPVGYYPGVKYYYTD